MQRSQSNSEKLLTECNENCIIRLQEMKKWSESVEREKKKKLKEASRQRAGADEVEINNFEETFQQVMKNLNNVSDLCKGWYKSQKVKSPLQAVCHCARYHDEKLKKPKDWKCKVHVPVHHKNIHGNEEKEKRK